MKIGVLTGGGDCPGLNAVIRAVVLRGTREWGHEFTGYLDGWKGPLENESIELGVDEVRGILAQGGTILGSSRTNPEAIEGGVDQVIDNVRAAGLARLRCGGRAPPGALASQLPAGHIRSSRRVGRTRSAGASPPVVGARVHVR
mgnify:CR=1 FL=1